MVGVFEVGGFPLVWGGEWDSEKSCLAWPNKENMSKMHDFVKFVNVSMDQLCINGCETF